MFAAFSPLFKRMTAAVSSSSAGVTSSGDNSLETIALNYAFATSASDAMVELLNAKNGDAYAVKS